MDKLKSLIVFIVLFLLVVLFFFLYQRTGIFGSSTIDERDLKTWNYDNGIIKGGEEFFIDGNNETCWLFIHGYSLTPNDFKEFAELVNIEFGDSVYGIRLKGHGELPSRLIGLSLDDWYEQVSDSFETMKIYCKKINVAGDSFGGALALRMAEEKNLNNIYLMGAYLRSPYKFYQILRPDSYVRIFADIFVYIKKTKIAQINSPEGFDGYVGYWSFPLQPVRDSYEFIDVVIRESYKIDENVLILHSINDEVADFKIMQNLFEQINSEKKKIVLFKKSNHIILKDYDKEDAIKEIFNFEKDNR